MRRQGKQLVGDAWKVEEDEKEDDEGPVKLTGIYKSLESDIKRLMERLRYYSKKLQIRSIAICEEDRSTTEERLARFVENTSACTVSCTAVNHEATPGATT